jgi:hypothetical protein
LKALSSEMWHVAASYTLLGMTAARSPEKSVAAVPPRAGSGPGKKNNGYTTRYAHAQQWACVITVT